MKVVYIFFICLFLSACQSAKDAFTLQKKSSTDEFLVEKKSPLVLPPDYGKLPVPDNKINEKDKKDETEIKKIVIGDDTKVIKKSENDSKPTSIEELILKKIK
ncbi:DUF3035 domain-containing protein [Candidatus Pelagibacter communis]|uniref:DUF3035 domain-containing protein n=1 Tax=Pelagibacter ubique TaxID=198252 RepID=UPI0009E2F374|nr:DUF3035 domain-containing protein [Candidatus Pelagibacter ubique]|tara:strand:- start:10 stop:318 length:309 start_codon:yes stop_codon:yes gene_type:complete